MAGLSAVTLQEFVVSLLGKAIDIPKTQSTERIIPLPKQILLRLKGLKNNQKKVA